MCQGTMVIDVIDICWLYSKDCEINVNGGVGMGLGWGRQELHTDFWWQTCYKFSEWEPEPEMGRITLRLILGCENGRWMELAQDHI
jgi:hypothetical protein